MKTLLVVLCGCAVLRAQDAQPVLFAHADFINIAPGKTAEYHKALAEIAVPKFKAGLAAGEAYAFVSFARTFPHGDDAADEVRFTIGKTIGGTSNGMLGTSSGFPADLYKTLQGEMWRTRYSVNLEKLLNARVVRALFLKAHPGSTSEDIVRIYRTGDATKRAAAGKGLLILDRLFSGRTPDDYSTIVLWGYDTTKEIDALYQQAPGQSPIEIAHLSHVRDVVRMELWTRRAEYAGPQ